MGAALASNYAGRGRQKNLLFHLGIHRLAQQQQEASSEEVSLMNSDKSPLWLDPTPQWKTFPGPATCGKR